MTDLVPLERERERVVQALAHHFAHDRLTMDGLDARMELAQQARDGAALQALLADLPVIGALPRIGSGEVAVPARVPPVGAALAHPTMHDVIKCYFAEQKVSGPLVLPRRLSVYSICGDLKIDLRDAQFDTEHELYVDATLGAVLITVPPGVRVVCRGSGIFGTFATKGFDEVNDHGVGPVLIVHGNAWFAEVTVKRIDPNQQSKRSKWLLGRAREK